MTHPHLAAEDVYPSRVSDRPAMLERKDPVVYGDVAAGAGPLDAEALARYERNGYLCLPGFFSASDVQTLRSELKRLWEQSRDADRNEVIREPDSRDIRSIFAVHRDHDAFRRLSRDPRIVGIARQILGSDVYIHQSRINYKKGFTGKEFYWHSDFETWHMEDGMPRMRALSCSITLEDNHHCNGPLLLIPGSHKTFVSCVGRTPEAHYEQSLRRQEYGVPDQESLRLLTERHGIEAAVGPAGTVVFFDCNIMHGSNSNITPLPRSNVFFVYNSMENRLTSPYSGQKPRPDYIATRG